MDYTCTEFHRYLNTRPAVLRHIASQEKYTFKQPMPIETSPGAMSVIEEE